MLGARGKFTGGRVRIFSNNVILQFLFPELWVDRSLVTNRAPLETGTGKKFTGGRVKLNGSDYLITLQTGVTLKVHPLKGSLSMDLILDDDYKGNVSGRKDILMKNCMIKFSNFL